MKKFFITLICFLTFAVTLSAEDYDAKSITIPASYNSIEFDYFNQFPKLEEVIFEDSSSPIIIPDYPDSLSYSKGMFDQTLLKTIHIGRTFVDIDGNIVTPFLNGSKTLEKVTFAETGSISLGQSFFADCIALESIFIPVNVYYKEARRGEVFADDVKGLFQGCISLKSAVISTLNSNALGLNMFRGCKSLTQVNWRASVQVISAGAFYGCESLVKELTSSLGIMWIGEYAFAECSAIEVLTIPDMSEIEKGAFMNCKNLKTLIFRSGPSIINDEAFYGCDAIEDIFYFGQLPRINESVFSPSVYETATLWREPAPQDGAWNNFVKRGKALSTTLPFIEISESNWDTKVTKPQQELEIKYEVHPRTMFDSIVEWTSSNSRVANFEKIDDGVRVIALGKGETTIKAQLSNGNSASCNVKVFQPIDSINFNLNDVELEITSQQQVYVKFYPENANNADMKNVRLTSSNDSIATIDENGIINAIGVGECEIKAMTTDGSDLSAICKVNVIPYQAKSILISRTNLRMDIGSAFQLNASVGPMAAYDKRVEWSTADPQIANVDETGKVYAKGIGETVITVKALGGKNVFATCEVRVTPVWVASIEVEPHYTYLHIGETLTLNATVLPEDAADKRFRWSSDNENVATVSEDGVITAHKFGFATIKATALDESGKEGVCFVEVGPYLVESLTIEPTEWEGLRGETFQLTATVFPENADNKELSWRISNPQKLTLSEDGLVETKEAGLCEITAYTKDGSQLSATCKVRIIWNEVESISLEPTEWSGAVGDTIKVIPHILPEDASDKRVNWESNNYDVANVDNQGLVTILKEGEAIISCCSAEKYWKRAEMRINATSGIVNIVSEDDGFDIYTPQGICLHRSADESILSELAVGLYILRSPGSNRVIKKITITH